MKSSSSSNRFEKHVLEKCNGKITDMVVTWLLEM
jgi:hypothetical protein